MSGRAIGVLELSQVLYSNIAPQVQAVVLTDGGGNAALSALATLLGQVYDQAPDELKPDFLREILHELNVQEPTDMDWPLDQPKRTKPLVH